MRHATLVWLTFLLPAGVCLPQQPPSSSVPPPAIRVNVDLVQFDVIVTDAKGNHVDALQPEDFEVLDEGKPQRITNFSYIAKTHSVTEADAQAPQAFAVNTRSVRPEEVTRTVAVVVDDLGMSDQSFMSMREAVQNFVEKQAQPGDLVAIVTTTGKLGALERVTADRRALRAAVERLCSTAIHRRGVLDADFESPCFDNDVATDYYARLSVATLRRVVDSLRELPGRKSILLFSEGIPVGRLPTPALASRCIHGNVSVPNEMLRREYQAFLLHAVRSGVTVNTIDPRGLIASFDTAEREQISSSIRSATVEERYQELAGSQQNLADIAHQTGGIAITNDNDLSAAMAQVLNEEDSYYLIAYKPSTDPPSERDGAPRVRNLVVRVNRPGLKVRFHSSLYAGAPMSSIDPAQRLANAALSPFAQSGIRVRCASHFWDAGEKAGMVLDTTLHIEARDLTFTTEPDGRRKAAFDVLAVIFGPEIKPLDTFEKSYTVALTGDAYRKALAEGLVQQLELPLRRGGAYQLRAAVRDRQSERIGSSSEFLEVPDLKHGGLALSGIVLQHTGSTAPAARFHSGETVVYAYQILNGQSHAGTVTVRVELCRAGAVLGASEPVRIDAERQADPKRIVASDHLRLGKQLAAGVYTLRVKATQERSKARPGVAQQETELEVIE